MAGSAMSPADGIPKTQKEMEALVARARQGDRSTLPGLRKMLEDPAAIQQLCGDLAQQVEVSLLGRFDPIDLAMQLALRQKLALLRAELGGPSPSPLERVLADRAVTCWMYLHTLELDFVKQERKLGIRQSEYFQKALDGAQKRFLAALKTLATVRRLALPVLQVNLADKQINVAGRAELE
jgi:hypothetical protein